MTTALYRRYRPETFADVIGQEHVTEPLMQALRTGRVNHAYLFSGPRGCGKTTSARILARCLNCEQGPTPEPCGVCESCVALARGGPGSVDVIEIDAASHGGVEDARDLRERASFGPAGSRYKIYIIDEAHMVTPQGFNALLKIVEEPPEHVKFVFATTEPEKVIGTIRSRTHHYPFRLVPPKKLGDYMERLLAAENVPFEPGVLSFVTRAGGGSVRDSLSVLDQLIAGSGPEGLTYSGAAALLGFTDDELLDGIIEAFAAGDSAGVFRQIDKVVESGADPRRFVEDLLERLRDLIVVAAVDEGAGAVLRSVPEDQLDRMRQQAASFGSGGLSRAADVINAGLSEMTGATSPRLQLELMCARVLLPGIAGMDGYAARLDRMERRLEMGELPRGADAGPVRHAPAAPPLESSAPSPQPRQRPQPVAAPERPQAVRPEEPVVATPAAEPVPQRSDAPAGHEAAAAPAPQASAPPAPRRGGMTTDDIRRMWPDVLDRVFRIKRVTWTLLSQNAQVIDFDGDRLVLGASSEGLAATMSRGQHPEVVRQALVEAMGVDARVEARAMRPGESVPATNSVPPGAGSPAASDTPSRVAESGPPRRGPERNEERGGQNAWGDRASAGDPPARPAPREADSPRQDAGLATAAAQSSAWGNTGPGDWESQSGPAPDWASADAPASPAPDRPARPAQDIPDEPPPDPQEETPAWMEDEPETDVEAVYDPLPPKDGGGEPAVAPGSASERVPEPDAASPEAASDGRILTPRQRAEKAAREHAQRDEDARRRSLDDTDASPDDEDIENSDSVGLPVITSILGGTVIKEEGPEQGA